MITKDEAYALMTLFGIVEDKQIVLTCKLISNSFGFIKSDIVNIINNEAK